MTSASVGSRRVAIGAFELKRTYQRNMMIGTLVVLLFYASILASVALVRALTETDVPVIVDRIITVPTRPLPPTVIKRPRPTMTVPKGVKPNIVLPTAVPDEEVAEEYTMISRDKLADLVGPSSGNDLDNNQFTFTGGPSPDEIFPRPDDFVPYEEAPVPLKLVAASYPVMAQRAGIEGEVWVKVLVDTEGKVRDAVVYIESGSNAGFEQAALDAALQGTWRPAMQNKQPVPVWAAYKIEFKLRSSDGY